MLCDVLEDLRISTQRWILEKKCVSLTVVKNVPVEQLEILQKFLVKAGYDEFVLLDFGSKTYYINRYATLPFFTYYTKGAEMWNRAAAINLAIPFLKYHNPDIVTIIDAYTVPESNQAEIIKENLEVDGFLISITRQADLSLLGKYPNFDNLWKNTTGFTGEQDALGLISVSFKDLVETKFDERFCGWGVEDEDFAGRLMQKGKKPKRILRFIKFIHPEFEGRTRKNIDQYHCENMKLWRSSEKAGLHKHIQKMRGLWKKL